MGQSVVGFPFGAMSAARMESAITTPTNAVEPKHANPRKQDKAMANPPDK
jgi:hypothetical protein